MLFDVYYSKCGIHQSRIVSREHGNEHILFNKTGCNVFQYRIDGDICHAGDGERCDYIVEAAKPVKPSAYLIELKGSDLNKAIRQIQSTIGEYKAQLEGYFLLPRIIIHRTSTHDIRGKKYRDFKKLYPETVVKDRKYDLDSV